MTEDQRRSGCALRCHGSVNSAFIPRDHIVELALDAAIANQDFALFKELLKVLSRACNRHSADLIPAAISDDRSRPEADNRAVSTMTHTGRKQSDTAIENAWLWK